jgi:hypothetical protein
MKTVGNAIWALGGGAKSSTKGSPLKIRSNKTTRLVEQIEEMHMLDQSRSEQDLVNTLGSVLRRADETLLEAVCSIAHAHELRRESIMQELHALATRMGILPLSQLPDRSLEDARLELGMTMPVGHSAP